MKEEMRFFEHPVLGFVVIKGSPQTGISSLDFLSTPPFMDSSSKAPLLEYTENLLKRYLLGEVVSFSDIPLYHQGSPFQSAVWGILATIEWGTKRSYKWVAEQSGRPEACRAVGQANKRNPVPVIIPCHRVISKDGSLGGYSKGLHIKRFLLDLETKS